MKMKNLVLIAFISVFLESCTPPSFFQVYKAASSGNMALLDKMFVFEDKNCSVTYNFWDEGGEIGFKFYNKTDNNIYLNMEESFFVLNGISNNYYKNRVFTNSASRGTTTSKGAIASKSITGVNYFDFLQTNKFSATNSIGYATTSGQSVSYTEEKIICIPSHTSKIISEYHINKYLLRDCDLFKYPSKKQIKSKTFSKSDSPFVYSNRIAYFIGKSDNITRFENEFYVTEITNLPQSEMYDFRYDKYCGQQSKLKANYFKETSPDKFYIQYTKGVDTWEH